MKAYQRVALGFALAGGGHLARAGLALPFDAFEAALAATGAGLLVAAGGLLAMHKPSGARALAGGFAFAALAALAALPLGYAGDWASIGDGFVALGVLFAALASARLVTAPAERPIARVAGLRLGAYVAALGASVLLLADITIDPLLALADAPTIAGFMIAGFAAGAIRAALGRTATQGTAA